MYLLFHIQNAIFFHLTCTVFVLILLCVPTLSLRIIIWGPGISYRFCKIFRIKDKCYIRFGKTWVAPLREFRFVQCFYSWTWNEKKKIRIKGSNFTLRIYIKKNKVLEFIKLMCKFLHDKRIINFSFNGFPFDYYLFLFIAVFETSFSRIFWPIAGFEFKFTIYTRHNQPYFYLGHLKYLKILWGRKLKWMERGFDKKFLIHLCIMYNIW